MKLFISHSRPSQCFLVVVVCIWTAFVFRPHGDTFMALDTSGYRLMAFAFAEGRGFHEEDRMLLDAPSEARQALMYLPLMTQRNTRDISFQVYSLNEPRTAPFYYPLVPILAAGLERLVPHRGLDLLMPLFGLLFFLSLMAVGWRSGRAFGVALAFVLAIGSPLPLWLFRGFYVEAAGAACMTAAIALWYVAPLAIRYRAGAGLLLGLAVSFHPVYMVIAVPLVTAMALDADSRLGASMALLLAFAAGFSVLLGMTEWICAPYGALSVKNMIFNFHASATHRLALMFGLGAVVIFLVGLSTRPWWRGRLRRIATRREIRVLLLLIAALPLLYAATKWQYAGFVRIGLHEAFSGLRWPLSALLVAGAMVTLGRRRGTGKAFVVLLVFMVTLPIFVYLKGAEQVGLWSQRRLLPPYGLVVMAILPGLAALARMMTRRLMPGHPMPALVLGFLFALAGFHNMVRWPSPYFERVDHGALEFVRTIRAEIGDRLVMFDYHPFSCPFAVDNRTRAVSIGQRSHASLNVVSAWLSQKAVREEIWWATAYSNPGLEDRVRLESVSVHTGSFARVASRGLLPAERRRHDIRIELLRAVPLESPGSGVVMDKILDGGPVALRGPWGYYRRTFRDEDGNVLPVDWSRQNSGVIGPLPEPGGRVTVEMWALSGQEGRAQILHVSPPWGGVPGELVVEPAFALYRLEMVRPADDVLEAPTGVFQLTVPTPYDPSTVGIHGFEPDLGVMVHRIRITSHAFHDRPTSYTSPL